MDEKTGTKSMGQVIQIDEANITGHPDESDWAGVAIFDASPEEVDRIMADDPGIQAGIFTYELHTTRSFPGSALP